MVFEVFLVDKIQIVEKFTNLLKQIKMCMSGPINNVTCILQKAVNNECVLYL